MYQLRVSRTPSSNSRDATYVEFSICLSVLESIAKIGQGWMQHPVIFLNDLALDESCSVCAVLR